MNVKGYDVDKGISLFGWTMNVRGYDADKGISLGVCLVVDNGG